MRNAECVRIMNRFFALDGPELPRHGAAPKKMEVTAEDGFKLIRQVTLSPTRALKEGRRDVPFCGYLEYTLLDAGGAFLYRMWVRDTVDWNPHTGPKHTRIIERNPSAGFDDKDFDWWCGKIERALRGR